MFFINNEISLQGLPSMATAELRDAELHITPFSRCGRLGALGLGDSHRSIARHNPFANRVAIPEPKLKAS
jgi:hypothetical protein